MNPQEAIERLRAEGRLRTTGGYTAALPHMPELAGIPASHARPNYTYPEFVTQEGGQGGQGGQAAAAKGPPKPP
eukprot:6192073-Pyramimonas_sp.AAC.2